MKIHVPRIPTSIRGRLTPPRNEPRLDRDLGIAVGDQGNPAMVVSPEGAVNIDTRSRLKEPAAEDARLVHRMSDKKTRNLVKG